MIGKTKGIILRNIKYNDKTNIVTIFTKDYGKKSFLVYGINSQKKGNELRNILHPLYLVAVEFYYKETQTLAKIKEISLDYPYTSIITDFNKKAILIFISEILQKTIYDHLIDKQLFDYIYNALKLLDLQPRNFNNFHIFFLAGLTKFLGIKPVNNFNNNNPFFSIPEAKFTENYDPGLSLDIETSQIFSKILNMNISEMDKIRLSRHTRSALLKALINFFAYHIDNFGTVNSLQILEDIFNA